MNTAEAFASAYADAVCAFLRTGALHHVNWSRPDHGWFADPADEGSGADDQDFLVGSTWPALVGPLAVATDPTAADFSELGLHAAVRARLLASGVAQAAVAAKV